MSTRASAQNPGRRCRRCCRCRCMVVVVGLVVGVVVVMSMRVEAGAVVSTGRDVRRVRGDGHVGCGDGATDANTNPTAATSNDATNSNATTTA